MKRRQTIKIIIITAKMPASIRCRLRLLEPPLFLLRRFREFSLADAGAGVAVD
jgi:hypothetical protein